MTSRGLEGVVANTTRLSDVIGDKGQLIYCGYDINELAGKVSYEEVVYLLWNNKLPNRKELECCVNQLRSQRSMHEGVVDFIKAAPKNAAPMDVIRAGVSMLGLYDPNIRKEATVEIGKQRARSITAKIGGIAAYFHRARNSQPLPPVREDLSEAAHFLYLMNGEPSSKEAADTLDLAFVLHADHGMNASTFSARVTISTLSARYSDGSFHAGLCDCTNRRLDGSRARAARRQSALSPAKRIRGRTGRQKGRADRRSTLIRGAPPSCSK